MLVQFTAHLLLDQPWRLDLPMAARAVAARFPPIGRVEPVAGATPHSGLLTIDEGLVVLMAPPGPMGEGELWPPFRPLRGWNPRPAVERHAARITVSCGGDTIPGIEGARAYAAAVTFVAAVLCELAPVCAVLWAEGWVMQPPEELVGAADGLLDGRIPVKSWIGFVPVVPRGFAPAEAQGMLTVGLVPFTGREIELAPAAGSVRSAWERVDRVVQDVLQDGRVLADRAVLHDPDTGERMRMRLVSSWWRRNTPACVLLGPGCLADPATLEIHRPPVVDGRGLFRRRAQG